MALPLFSNICIHLYWAAGGVIWVDGGSGEETLERGEEVEMWAVYILVHSSIIGTISLGERSARVML